MTRRSNRQSGAGEHAAPIGSDHTSLNLQQALESALALHRSGRYDEAAASYTKLLNVDKSLLVAQLGLGDIEFQRGDYRKAAKRFERVLKKQPDSAEVHLALARTRLAQGEPAAAKKSANRAVRLDERFESLVLMGEICETLGERTNSIAHYQRALALNETSIGLWINLGALFRQNRQFDRALECLERALMLAPENLSAMNNKANVLKDLGDYAGAVSLYSIVMQSEPDNDGARFNLGLCYQMQGDLTRASAEYDAIPSNSSLSPQARIQKAECLINAGDFDSAETLLNAEIENESDEQPRAWHLKSSLRRYTDDDTAIVERLVALSKKTAKNREARMYLDFALGKIFDDLGQYANAFKFYESANSNAYGLLGEANSVRQQLFDALTSAPYDPALSNMEPPAGSPAPIFVIGMPRSGTTLVEQVLARHEDVAAGGELNYFADALRRETLRRSPSDPFEFGDALNALTAERATTIRDDYLDTLRRLGGVSRFVIDKTPANYYFVGLLKILFPAALFINLERHPLDTALSIYFQLFAGVSYAYRFADIADEYGRYRQLIDRWFDMDPSRLYTVRYDEIVSNPERQLDQVLNATSLNWSPVMLDATRTPTAVASLSRWQVRQPMYTTSIERWKRYAPFIGELQNAMRDLVTDYERRFS